MFVELSKEMIVIAAGSFLVGCFLATVFTRLCARFRVKERDPRDDRIRELEAESRIASSEREKSIAKIEKLDEMLKDSQQGIESRDGVVTDQQSKLEKLTSDLKESVTKTRELRTELTDRATENVHAEAKIREVETELSVAQASTDMIVTGVLDYSFDSDNDDTGETTKLDDANRLAKETGEAAS